MHFEIIGEVAAAEKSQAEAGSARSSACAGCTVKGGGVRGRELHAFSSETAVFARQSFIGMRQRELEDGSTRSSAS